MSSLALEISIPMKVAFVEFTGSFREEFGTTDCPALLIRARGPGICTGCFRKSARRPTLSHDLLDQRVNGLSCRVDVSSCFAPWPERTSAFLLGEAWPDACCERDRISPFLYTRVRERGRRALSHGRAPLPPRFARRPLPAFAGRGEDPRRAQALDSTQHSNRLVL
jgi:hypothetical protein